MQGDRRPIYKHRLVRDLSELLSHNFSCISSVVTILDNNRETVEPISTHYGPCISVEYVLRVQIYEGPYRGGCFRFQMHIPECYPFRPVDVRAEHPIWHPNIDLQTGSVILPLEWSPTLTLNSVALAVQMIMLEPSAENPTNLDAYHYCMMDSVLFDCVVQKSVHGGVTISGVTFVSVLCESVVVSSATNESIKEDRLMDDGSLDEVGMGEEVCSCDRVASRIGSVNSVEGRARKRVATPPSSSLPCPSSGSESSERSSGKRRRVSLITSSIHQLSLDSS